MNKILILGFISILCSSAFADTYKHRYYREGDNGVPAGTAFGIGLLGAVTTGVTMPLYPLEGYKKDYYGKQWYYNPYYDSTSE